MFHMYCCLDIDLRALYHEALMHRSSRVNRWLLKNLHSYRFNLGSSLATNLRNIQTALFLSLGILNLL